MTTVATANCKVNKSTFKDWKDWKRAVEANSTEKYQAFLSKHPESVFASEARRRVADEPHAMLETFQIGSREAAQGFLRSHPDSGWRGLLQDYLDFIREAGDRDADAIRKFQAKRPANPFGQAAAYDNPLLCLKAEKAKVGVSIAVGNLVFKGAFGGGKGTPEKAREKLWQALKGRFDAEGVPAVLLAPGDDPAKAGGITHHLAYTYTEKNGGQPVRRSSETLW